LKQQLIVLVQNAVESMQTARPQLESTLTFQALLLIKRKSNSVLGYLSQDISVEGLTEMGHGSSPTMLVGQSKEI
jgi:hypothetical protein